MSDPCLEEVKVVVFREAFTRKTVPQSGISRGGKTPEQYILVTLGIQNNEDDSTSYEIRNYLSYENIERDIFFKAYTKQFKAFEVVTD